MQQHWWAASRRRHPGLGSHSGPIRRFRSPSRRWCMWYGRLGMHSTMWGCRAFWTESFGEWIRRPAQTKWCRSAVSRLAGFAGTCWGPPAREVIRGEPGDWRRSCTGLALRPAHCSPPSLENFGCPPAGCWRGRTCIREGSEWRCKHPPPIGTEVGMQFLPLERSWPVAEVHTLSLYKLPADASEPSGGGIHLVNAFRLASEYDDSFAMLAT